MQLSPRSISSKIGGHAGLAVAFAGGFSFGLFSPCFNVAVNDELRWSRRRVPCCFLGARRGKAAPRRAPRRHRRRAPVALDGQPPVLLRLFGGLARDGRPAPPDMSTVHKTPKYGSKEDVFTGSGYLWASVLQDASWPWRGPSVFCVTLPFICESAILLQPFIAITTGARPDQ